MRASVHQVQRLLRHPDRRAAVATATAALSTTSAAGLPTKHVLYKAHVPTSPLQKIAVAVGSAFTVFTDPERGDMLAALGDVTGAVALRQMHLKMYSDPVGRQILAEKPRFRSHLVDIDALRLLPTDTFGFAYTQFMDAHGFEADGRADVKFVDDPELAYVMQRYRELHDFWHVLYGLPPTEFAEIILKFVELVQTGLPVCTLSGFVGPLRLTSGQRRQLLCTYIPWAHRAGKHAPFLMNVYYEKEFHTPLADLRARLGILLPPPPKDN
ncbi:Aste57867_279 [Aphanomyces stellatus]|uniref:Ubiquinone biosynthesis protein COQ4 homolog, mitochondrial n=1 Tax=Aphanomyces stellatus TaxID=120398 RepID=A0A485K2E7_9STRA|nr:hypothetical protein As57867_000279 [Aphanomyces stellatus]VFT77505.1 Aste57867_279 [Aphanomyces stellatus]